LRSDRKASGSAEINFFGIWEERARIDARDAMGNYMLDSFRAGEVALYIGAEFGRPMQALQE